MKILVATADADLSRVLPVVLVPDGHQLSLHQALASATEALPAFAADVLLVDRELPDGLGAVDESQDVMGPRHSRDLCDRITVSTPCDVTKGNRSGAGSNRVFQSFHYLVTTLERAGNKNLFNVDPLSHLPIHPWTISGRVFLCRHYDLCLWRQVQTYCLEVQSFSRISGKGYL